MALSTKPYKGTRDFYPPQMRVRQQIFSQLQNAAKIFGFEQYDGPMLEPFELYAAKTGEEIVEQQLYWLNDRGDRKMAIRPEMTPTLARMVAQQLMELPKPIRWFSLPNLWRYERPQKGRLREHWQLNCDILGGDPLLADLEIIELCLFLMDQFKGKDRVNVRVNHRGIVDAFFEGHLKLKPDVYTKVIKLIDAKDKIGDEKFKSGLNELGVSDDTQKEIQSFFAWNLNEVSKNVPCEAVGHLQQLFERLKESQLDTQVVYDPSIMRGMDYYTGMVFETYDTSPENKRAMFGGGRYDNLIGLFGKQKLSGIGFGMGDVTIEDFLTTHGLLPEAPRELDVYVTLPADSLLSFSSSIVNDLRNHGIRTMTPLEAGKFSNQLKAAAKHEAQFALILGDEEAKNQSVVVKQLSTGDQKTIKANELVAYLQKNLE